MSLPVISDGVRGMHPVMSSILFQWVLTRDQGQSFVTRESIAVERLFRATQAVELNNAVLRIPRDVHRVRRHCQGKRM